MKNDGTISVDNLKFFRFIAITVVAVSAIKALGRSSSW